MDESVEVVAVAVVTGAKVVGAIVVGLIVVVWGNCVVVVELCSDGIVVKPLSTVVVLGRPVLVHHIVLCSGEMVVVVDGFELPPMTILSANLIVNDIGKFKI